MADFSAADLVAAAKARYNEKRLRDNIRGAFGDNDKADLELTKIALSVISRVQAAAAASVGWPLPGTWPAGSTDAAGANIAGTPYRDIWSPNLLENALQLFNWRTLAGLEQVSEEARRVGKMAEDFFDRLQQGGIALGLATKTDVRSPEPVAARDRSGRALISGVQDRENVLEAFSGPGWDW